MFGILVRWYLVGLVEPVDTRVAESAKKLWLEELPASHKHGEIGNGRKVDNSNCSLHNASASGLLSRLKRDHPDLAQQVIDGDMSATKAARAVGARIVRSGSRLKERAIYNL